MDVTLDEALQKAIQAHKAGQKQEANHLYTAILKAHPKHPDANHNMGVLGVSIGKVQEALPFFKTALEANPNMRQFWLSYIDTLIKLDRLAEAKGVLKQAKDKGAKGEAFDQLEQRLTAPHEMPAEADLHNDGQSQTSPNVLDRLKLDQAIRLAKKMSKGGASEDAKRIYDDVLAKFPDNKRAIDGIRSLSGQLIDKSSNVQNPTQDQLQPLINLYSQGQLQQALDQAKQLLQQFPNSITLHNMCGVASNGIGQYDDAIESFYKALKIQPDFAEAYNGIGNAQRDKGDLETAIDSFKQAVTIKPDFAEAYNNMGNALGDKGDLKASIDSYEQALKIKPDYAEAYYNMGNALQSKGDIEAAIGSFKQALKIKPDFAEAYNNMGAALRNNGDLEAAIGSFKQALKLYPGSNKLGLSQTKLGLSQTLIMLGRHTESIEAVVRRVNQTKAQPGPKNRKVGSMSPTASPFNKPKPLEYPEHFRPGMGTEDIAPFLRSMVQMVRPNRVLEIGAGYTTPFLLEGLVNNERVFDDGNLDEPYFANYSYDPKLVVIDDMSQGDVNKKPGMKHILESPYVEFINGLFQGKSHQILEKYGKFDFVWFDCGSFEEYEDFLKEYWSLCSNYLFFHYTYSDGAPNIKLKTLLSRITDEPFRLDIIEPHKKRQGSITIIKKQSL